MTAKVRPEVQSFANGKIGKVLTTKGDDLALGDVAGELVLASVVEGAQLDAANFCADGGSKVGGLCALREEVLEGGVRIFAVFVVVELGQGRILLLWVPSREVVGVLKRQS